MVRNSPANKLSRVGGGGWLDQVGIRLSQLSTKLKLKLKLKLSLAIFYFGETSYENIASLYDIGSFKKVVQPENLLTRVLGTADSR